MACCAWPARSSRTCASTPPTSTRAHPGIPAVRRGLPALDPLLAPRGIEDHLTALVRDAAASSVRPPIAGPDRLAGAAQRRGCEFADMRRRTGQRRRRPARRAGRSARHACRASTMAIYETFVGLSASNRGCRPERMLLEIRHLTQYHYAEPVRESVMELWMQPQKSGDASGCSASSSSSIRSPSCSPTPTPSATPSTISTCPQPHDRLKIVARSAVETEARRALPEALDLGEWDRLRSDFIRATASTSCARTASRGARRCSTPSSRRAASTSCAGSTRSAPRASSATLIYGAFDYETGVTEADSPIDHALAEGRGRLPGLRPHHDRHLPRLGRAGALRLRLPVHRPAQKHDRSDPDATHAWVEVFLPSLRWVGLDPTNNIRAGERHVLVAVGRDYGDVPPSRGVFKGDAESQLAVGVSVRRARAAVAEPEFLRMAKPAFAAGSPPPSHLADRPGRPAAPPPAAATTAAVTSFSPCGRRWPEGPDEGSHALPGFDSD